MSISGKDTYTYWWINFTDYGSQILDLQSSMSAASVAKQIYGSSIVNSAQDLERKLMPWKQAREMFLPWRLMVPPMTVSWSGKVHENMDILQPLRCSSTFCQCRWWRISDIQESEKMEWKIIYPAASMGITSIDLKAHTLCICLCMHFSFVINSNILWADDKHLWEVHVLSRHLRLRYKMSSCVTFYYYKEI